MGQRVVRNLALLFMLGICSVIYLGCVFIASQKVHGVRYFTLGDDAMISMRYANQLAHGHGLVWNIGDRVQGFTNLGWTLVMAGVHLLNLPLRFNALVIQLINLGLHLGLVFFVYRQLHRSYSKEICLTVAFLICFNIPLITWALKGFEASLQTLLLTLAFMPLLTMAREGETDVKSLYRLPIFCVLAFIVRPDAILFCILGIGIGAILLSRLQDEELRKRSLLPFSITCLVALAVIASIFWFQYAYYGDVFPNTYSLKMNSGARNFNWSLEYFRLFLFEDWQALYLVMGLGYAVHRLRQPAERPYYSCLLIIWLAWMGYIFWSGGDIFQHSRFFLPILPLLIATSVLGVRDILVRCLHATTRQKGGWNVELLSPCPPAYLLSGLTAATLLGIQYLSFYPALQQYMFSMKLLIRENVGVAIGIRKAYPDPNICIGVYVAGITPYYMPEYCFHDLLGKSDRHIAHVPAIKGVAGHNKWDYDYSLGQVAPDLIVTMDKIVGIQEAQRIFDRENRYVCGYAIELSPLFIKYYLPNRVPLNMPSRDARHWVYARNPRNPH